MQLSGLPKCAERYRDNFQRLNCLNAIQKQLLSTAAANKRGEDKHLYSCYLACHWSPPTIQANRIHSSRHITVNRQRERDRKVSNATGGSTTSATIEANWTLWNWHGCCHTASNNNILYSASTTIIWALSAVQITKCNRTHINMSLQLA